MDTTGAGALHLFIFIVDLLSGGIAHEIWTISECGINDSFLMVVSSGKMYYI
jgi:hypothetical protein